MTPRQQRADSGISHVCRQLCNADIFLSLIFFFFSPFSLISLSLSLSNSPDLVKNFRQRVSRLWQKFMSMLRLSRIEQALYWNLSNVWPLQLNCSLLCTNAHWVFYSPWLFHRPDHLFQGKTQSGSADGEKEKAWETEGGRDKERGIDCGWCKRYRAMGLVQGGKKCIPTHARLHVSLSDSDKSSLLSLHLCFSVFLSSTLSLSSSFSFPVCLTLSVSCSHVCFSFFSTSLSPVCSLLNRPETRLKQAESQRQWHS